MKALTYVEMDLDYCALSYGVAPCTAALGVTGDRKCFNTIATCQVRDDFDNAPVTVRHARAADYRPLDIEAMPDIESVSYTPAVISLGEDLGQRASLSVAFNDHPHSDTGAAGDRYLADRDYNPWTRGTYWGKFRARQTFLRGRKLRWKQGLVGQSLGEMDTRHFVMESFDGPTLDGRFTVIAKDLLKLLDGDRAQAPVTSRGYLNADATGSDTAIVLSPAGIGASYPSSGWANIGGKEIVSFTRASDTLTITRAQYNTAAVAHNAGDRVQLCLRYQAEDPAEVIADLAETYAGVPSGNIPLEAWQAETAAYYRRVVTALIPEPTPVKTLVNELIQQCGLALWWDDVEEMIRLQVLRAIATDAERFHDGNILAGSLKVSEQATKRISQVWTYFGILNPLKGVSDADNFRSMAVDVDLDAEEDYGQPAIKKIFSRWIPFGGLTVARRLNQILLGRFRTAPRRIGFLLFRRGPETPSLGEGCRIEGLPLQDATGARVSVPGQIVKLKPRDDAWEVEAEEQLFVDLSDEDLSVQSIIIDAYTPNVVLRALHDDLYPPPVEGDVVEVTVNAGVKVGSTSTANPAFDVGDWPQRTMTGNRSSGSAVISAISVDTAGLTAGMFVRGTGIPAGAKILSVDSSSQITLDKNASSSGTGGTLTVDTVILTLKLRGRIQGKGGPGGNTNAGAGGINGGAGGIALYSRYGINVELDVGSGEIWGGGGGGGAVRDGYGHGCAGGGGAGSQPGAAGSFLPDTPHTPPTAATTEAGGQGSVATSSTTRGGDGGAPGLLGADAVFSGTPTAKGIGGAAGGAIDGASYIVKTGTGDIRGAETN